MNRSPTCCAILLNYNHGAYLPHVLDAALGQTVPFDEIIIVDDASTDDSMAIITKRTQGISHVKLVANKVNGGIASAVNAAIQAATADFIYFLSADDDYSLHIMEWVQAALKRYPDAAMVSGNARVCNTHTGIDREFILPFPQTMGRYLRKDLEAAAKKRNVTFYGGANLIRRDAMVKAGGQLPLLKWHADWFLYLLIACRHPFAVVPQEFTRIRQSNTQYSHACHDWKQQKPVITAFLYTLKEHYPDEYNFFRESALLPTYDINTLPLLFADKSLRHYLTPLLAWRLLSYKPMRMVGKFLPEKFRARVRKWLML